MQIWLFHENPKQHQTLDLLIWTTHWQSTATKSRHQAVSLKHFSPSSQIEIRQQMGHKHIHVKKNSSMVQKRIVIFKCSIYYYFNAISAQINHSVSIFLFSLWLAINS